MHLLYRLAEWHALAKLRMHTESTLAHMDSVTKKLAHEIRKFHDQTCPAFATDELPRDEAARSGKQQNGQATKVSECQVASSSRSQCPVALDVAPVPSPSSLQASYLSQPASVPPKKRKKKPFNISTYKYHAMGDYVQTIRMFGTTDSYSTQTVNS
jgi:hypothetical protein